MESDARVNDIVRRLGGSSLWIGYHDVGNEAGSNADQFRRIDNDVEIGGGFEAFGGGEPNNSSDEDCVEARLDIGWNDNACNESRGYVCELR